MPAFTLDLESLLAPLSADSPSGANLEYDPQFSALEQAGFGKPERQYGDAIYPAEPPEWPRVYELSLELATRTRDLRIAVWLLRSAARLHGLAGAVQGLRLLHGLLEQHWGSVHPQLDAAEDNDPTMRLNALAPLFAPEAVLADLRAAPLAAERGSLTWRELELGLGAADAVADEATPTEAGVLQALEGLLANHPEVAELAAAARSTGHEMAGILEKEVGAGRAPDFAPLFALLDVAAEALGRVRGAAGAATAPAAAAVAPGVVAPASPTSTITTREDVLRELDRVCSWIERNEPSNPAPLLIRRAQRLMNKSFIDIIRDLTPDAVDQVERLAGSPAQA